MADDTFDWTVLIRLATQGGAKTESELNTVTGAVDRLAKRNKWSEQTVTSLSKSVVNASNRMKAASVTNLTAQEKAFLRNDKLYADYLGHQEKYYAKQAALQSKYQEQQWQADKKAAEQRDALFTSPTLRYALYDISRQAAVVSVALTGIGVAAVATAASFESAFTNVQRTLDETVSPQQIEGIRQELLKLSTEIPKSFQDLSAIATLGNQLGISEGKLTSFTETIAKFSAVSGISAEETAKTFGAFRTTLGLSESEFENFGSAVELVGRKSAATDQDILSLTREIGQQAHQAGFTADQVVALAGTLGELRVPPERARGSLTTYFQTLNSAVATGGKDLQNFATIVGVTADELSTMVRNGQGVEVFQKFIQNLNSRDTVAQTQALQELGLAQLRVTDVFQRLGAGAGKFNEFLGLSSKAYADNTELARQYALVVDDLASRWQIFLNSLANFGAAVGSILGPAVAQFLNFLSDGLQNLTEFVNSGPGKGLVIVAGALTALAAAVAGLVAVITGGLAVMIAFRGALRIMSIEAATAGGGIRALTAAMLGLEAGATRGAVALRVLRLALVSTGIGALIVALGFVISLFIDWKATLRPLIQLLHFAADAAVAFGNAMRWIAQVGLSSFSWIPQVAQWLKDLASVDFGAFGTAVHNAWDTLLADSDATVQSTSDLGASLGGAFAAMNKVGGAASNTAPKIGKVGNSAGGAAKQIRTLVDYANDLSEVWSRAFDIRFNSQSALDKITTAFYNVQDATAEAQKNIRSLQADLLGLNSDLNIQQRFLAVATQYRDADRMQAIQANIADLQAQIADKTASLTDEQSKNNKTLKGNTKAAIANRETILGMVKGYEDYVKELAASGLSQDQLKQKVAQLKQQFIDQAVQLGYNRSEISKYATAFDDMAIAINKVPRNITVTANTNPALQALNEFIAKANSSKASVGIGAGGLGDPAAQGANAGKTYAQAFNEQLAKKRTVTAVKDSSIPGGIRYYVTMDGKRLGTGFFNKGGFTGQGGYNEPAGIVHRGEYVIPKKYVNQSTGLPYADALGRLQRGAQGRGSYATGGYVNPSTRGRQTVDISAFSIQQLAQVMDKFIVVNGKVVAETATTQFGNQTANGDY